MSININHEDLNELDNSWGEIKITDGLYFVKSPSNRVFIKIHPESMRKGIFISKPDQYNEIKNILNSNEIEEALALL